MRWLIVASVLIMAVSGAEAQPVTNPTVVPVSCSGTVVTGGTAVTPIAAQSVNSGFIIQNLDTAEPLWISFTGTAVAAAVGSFALPPGTATTYANVGMFVSPIYFGLGGALSVVAATSGHKFSCVKW
jgi:hypothetical protein